MKAPRMNQKLLRKLYWLVSSVGSLIQLLGSSHCIGENLREPIRGQYCSVSTNQRSVLICVDQSEVSIVLSQPIRSKYLPGENIDLKSDGHKHDQSQNIDLEIGDIIKDDTSDLTSVVNGSRKASSEGGAALGFTYRIDIPKFIQGRENENADALAGVTLMSAIAKSALSSITSPSIPFQLPGDVSLPYLPSSTSFTVKLNPRRPDNSVARSMVNPSNLAFPSNFL